MNAEENVKPEMRDPATLYDQNNYLCYINFPDSSFLN